MIYPKVDWRSSKITILTVLITMCGNVQRPKKNSKNQRSSQINNFIPYINSK